MKQIETMIQESDMVLIGVGDEFTEKKNSREDILKAYQKLMELVKGKPWFLVTVNTDDLVYDAGVMLLPMRIMMNPAIFLSGSTI